MFFHTNQLSHLMRSLAGSKPIMAAVSHPQIEVSWAHLLCK